MVRIADGDRDAFRLLYDRHAARLHGLLLRLVGCRSAAEDVLQEAFWQIWSQASRFDASRGTAIVWIVLLARSRAHDYRRRQRRQPPPPVSQPGASEPGSEVVAREWAGLVSAALAQLPEEQRSAIRLAFYDGMSHSEIADEQSTPLGTIKTRIRSGMQRLREIVKPRDRVMAP
ncbi:MAG: ECF RNA polymerase sigma factor SigK [Phycisphaerae bacterium]|nr:ECF RNA polymerase sigma factor SigK [Phycisphaerae bacterium]